MKYSLLKNKLSGERSVQINKTGEIVRESVDLKRYNDLRKKALNSLHRKQRDDLMESCGLTKVRGAVSGKVYWE